MTDKLLSALHHLHYTCYTTCEIPFAAASPSNRKCSCSPRKVHCKDPPETPNVSIHPESSSVGSSSSVTLPSPICPAPGHALLPALPFHENATEVSYSTARSLVQTPWTENHEIKKWLRVSSPMGGAQQRPKGRPACKPQSKLAQNQVDLSHSTPLPEATDHSLWYSRCIWFSNEKPEQKWGVASQTFRKSIGTELTSMKLIRSWEPLLIPLISLSMLFSQSQWDWKWGILTLELSPFRQPVINQSSFSSKPPRLPFASLI